MPQALEIPAQASPLDPILELIQRRENSKGDPKARGKAGEIGLFQIMPQTGKMYGINDPKLLENPVINRWVAKRYMADLLSKYKGDLPLALQAYNAGPGNVDKGTVPTASKSYARKILEGLGGDVSTIMGEGTAAGADWKPESDPVPIGKTWKPEGAPVPIKPTPTPSQPWPVRVAGALPIVGQIGGEFAGSTLGAAVPGAGETGLSEYAGAVAGGGLGSAGGAEVENRIRRIYGLPPVSVTSEGLWGAGGSAVGGAIPLASRFRKAAKIASATGKSFSDALEEVTKAEAALESTLGIGKRKAAMLANAPANQAQKAYNLTRETGLKELGAEYSRILQPYANKKTANTVEAVLGGRTGKMLELTGKPLRQAIEDEIHAEPMTVRRAQVILSQLRQIRRSLNPDSQRVALSAIGDLEKALKADIRNVVGQTVSQQLDALDTYYARQIARFPQRAVRAAFTEPQAAEAILASKPGDAGRVVEVIQDMRRTGQIAALQRATATRIYQKAAAEGATNPGAELKALQKAVESIKPEIFDELYGKGAQKLWVNSAKTIAERHGDLLKHPDEAAAVAVEVKNYLSQPGVLARMTHFFGHRALWGAMMAGGGYEFGSKEMAMAGAGLLGIEGYEMVAHSPTALRLLSLAAAQKTPRAVARLIIAALGAAARTGGEKALGDDSSTKGGS